MIFEKNTPVTKLVYGDSKTFEFLFKTYYKKLVLFANRLTNDVHISEEIVEDVFTLLWEKGHEIEFSSSVGTYLFKMVRNRCLNHIKHEKIKSFYVNYLTKNSLWDETLRAVNNDYDEKELIRQIKSALDTLPDRCREVFLMSRFGELKYREIAAQLEISTKTVERHIGLALEKLRKLLKQ